VNADLLEKLGAAVGCTGIALIFGGLLGPVVGAGCALLVLGVLLIVAANVS
jgi:hypothetical protein